MSRILALETSTDQSSIAVMDGEDLLFEWSLRHGRDLSRTLTAAIQQAFRTARIEVQSIDAVAVSVGPGSFTGLRIGVTVAKTVAWALQKPSLAVSTLEGLAQVVPAVDGQVVMPVLDARRNELFLAAFYGAGGNWAPARDDALVAIDALPGLLNVIRLEAHSKGRSDVPLDPREIRIISAGRIRGLAEQTEGYCLLTEAYPQARNIASLGHRMLQEGQTTRPLDLVPYYIRRSYAEEKAGARTGETVGGNLATGVAANPGKPPEAKITQTVPDEAGEG